MSQVAGYWIFQHPCKQCLQRPRYGGYARCWECLGENGRRRRERKSRKTEFKRQAEEDRQDPDVRGGVRW